MPKTVKKIKKVENSIKRERSSTGEKIYTLRNVKFPSPRERVKKLRKKLSDDKKAEVAKLKRELGIKQK